VRAFPPTRTLISYVVRMNREPIRSPARSVANLEFHHSGEQVNEVARQVVALLERHGVRALNPAMGFPMEMAQFPGKTWLVIAYPFVKTEKAGFLKCMLSFLGDGCERSDPRPFFRLVPAPVDHPTLSRPRGGRLESLRAAPPSSGPSRARLGLDRWGRLV
jgi:hypothetical protein